MVASGPRVFAQTADALLLSIDAGVTFAPVSEVPFGWRPLPMDGTTLFAGGNGADSLRVSSDDGATWGTVQDDIWVTSNFGSGSVSFSTVLTGMVAALADGDAVLVAGTAYVFGGVYRHAPGDTAWTPLVQPGAPFNATSVSPLSLVRHGGALWFAHTGGVHRSADNGTTWTDVSTGLPASTSGVELYPGAVGLVAASRTGSGLARWNGSGWTALPAPPAPALALASGDALYASTASRVYAFDGTAWNALPELVASSPVPVAATASGALVVASGAQLLRSTTGGASWTAVLNGALIGRHAVTPGRIVVATGVGLRRSVDDGTTWTAIAQPTLPANASSRNPNALVAHGDVLFALHGYTRGAKHVGILERYGAAFRSLDGGTTWTEVSAGIPQSPLGPWPILAGVSFPGAVFAQTDGGCVRLVDGATAWTPAACPAGVIRDVAGDGTTRIVRTPTGLSASSDGGATWAPLVSGLPVPTGSSEASRFWSRSQFARTSGGLLLVADAGDGFDAYRLDAGTWTVLPTSFPDGVAWGGFIEAADRTLYGGSLGRGLWKASGAVATDSPAGLALALARPTPNPSRGAVHVRFSLPDASSATVAVFDALGRRVAVLADGVLGAGDHEALWDAGAAAGTYVVRLTTPDGTLARAVTVVR
jgi:hypothetical protein